MDAGLISEEKYKRLIRGNGFEPSELAGFISRQLVETRQSTKAAASILQQVIPDTQIVYVKAPTVSKFRKDFKFLKVREMNDYHHAKDAYLNIVVGNAYFVKFTSNPIHFIKENPGRSYNLKKMFEQEKIERNGEIAWESGNGTIATVRNFMEKNNILVTRRSYEATGALFDQQIVKKEKVRFRSRAVMNGFVIYRSMEDITKRRELTLYWQNRRAKRERKYEQSSMCRFV